MKRDWLRASVYLNLYFPDRAVGASLKLNERVNAGVRQYISPTARSGPH